MFTLYEALVEPVEDRSVFRELLLVQSQETAHRIKYAHSSWAVAAVRIGRESEQRQEAISFLLTILAEEKLEIVRRYDRIIIVQTGKDDQTAPLLEVMRCHFPVTLREGRIFLTLAQGECEDIVSEFEGAIGRAEPLR